MGTSAQVVNEARSALSKQATIESRVQLLGGNFPLPVCSRTEVISADGIDRQYGWGLPETGSFDIEDVEPSPQLHWTTLRDEYLWASLCCVFIFFSVLSFDTGDDPSIAHMNGAAETARAPHALVDIRKVSIEHVDTQNFMLTLTGSVTAFETDPAVVVILFLPDGRWREVVLDRMEMKLGSAAELKKWMGYLDKAPEAMT